MLETPSIRRYCLSDSENASGADNQQGSRPEFGLTPQRPHAGAHFGGQDMVRTVWRHAEVGRDDRPAETQIRLSQAQACSKDPGQ